MGEFTNRSLSTSAHLLCADPEQDAPSKRPKMDSAPVEDVFSQSYVATRSDGPPASDEPPAIQDLSRSPINFISTPSSSATPSSSSSHFSLLNMSSASSNSSMSSFGQSSSPLATYSVNRTYAHVPTGKRLYQKKNNHTSKVEYRHPNSRFLQVMYQLLERLYTGCAFCWAMGNPDPSSHQFYACPIVRHPSSNFTEALKDFRGGISIPKSCSACYGCYIPKVRLVADLVYHSANVSAGDILQFERPRLPAIPQRLDPDLLLFPHSSHRLVRGVVYGRLGEAIP